MGNGVGKTGVSRKLIKFNQKAFPRVFELQNYIKSFHEQKYETKTSNNIPDIGTSWIAMFKEPRVLIYHTNEVNCDPTTNDYAVKIIAGEEVGTKSRHMPNFEEKNLMLVILVLRCSDEGSLTAMDRQLFDVTSTIPEYYRQHMLFQVNDQLTPGKIVELCQEINRILNTGYEDKSILHRIFSLPSKELPIRLSIYFEKQILKYFPDAKIEIREKLPSMKHFEQAICTWVSSDKATDMIVNGPLEYTFCLGFLCAEAVKFKWTNGRYTSNTTTLDTIECRIARFVGKKLGYQIAEKICETLVITACSYKVDQLFLPHKTLKPTLSEQIQTILHSYINHEYKRNLEIYVTEDLMSKSFRHNIAKDAHGRLMENRSKIALDILTTFANNNGISALIKGLDRVEKVKCTPFIVNNKRDCLYHELRMLSKRNPLIHAFGCDGKELFVSVKNVERDKNDVERYLSDNMDNAETVHVRKFKKKAIKEMFVHRSGDTIEVPKLRDRCRSRHNNEKSKATATLFLSDSNGRQYFVTCSHVTVGLKEHEVVLFSRNGVRYRSDQIKIPSECLDFCVVRLDLSSPREPIQVGIRDLNRRREGHLYERDSITIPHGTTVFKWGAISGFTSGKYIGIIEDKTDSELEESYPFFEIENTYTGYEFAMPGDSGSLIYFEFKGLIKAAFVLLGRDEENKFVGNRLADGLKLIEKEIVGIKHFLNSDSITASVLKK